MIPSRPASPAVSGPPPPDWNARLAGALRSGPDGVVRAVERCRSHHLYNLGNSDPIALRDMIAALGVALGREPIIRQLPEQPGDVRQTYADVTRARDELHLSSVILARQMTPFDATLERPDAFTLGRFRVVPNLDATYRNGNLLAFYYQVHGAAFEPASGRRRLDVSLQFAAQQGETWLELGDPILYHDQENPQGWSAPMRDWPPATLTTMRRRIWSCWVSA